MFQFDVFNRNKLSNPLPNLWDFLAFLLIGMCFLMIGGGMNEVLSPAGDLSAKSISLDLEYLPYYAGRSVFRLFIAIVLAVIATFLIGALAVKNRVAEIIIIPIIDVLQSIPVLAFLQISVFFAVHMFPDRVLGVELAAIIAIFMAQAWSMILSFYQSLKSVPESYYEMAKIFRLSVWQVFWQIEVPSARPGLIFNAMLSLSASWFAVVEAEVMQIGHTRAYLPGLGSYIKVAQDQGDLGAIGCVILTMLLVILIYDHLIFRPMQVQVARYEDSVMDHQDHWLLTMIARAKSLGFLKKLLPFLKGAILLSMCVCGLWGGYVLAQWLWQVIIGLSMDSFSLSVDWEKWWVGQDVLINLVWVTLISALRIVGILIICLLFCVPLGIFIGTKPVLAKYVQPVIQMLAAFPPNVLYPVMMYFVFEYELNPEIWVFPLIMIAAQWYILFNVIAAMLVIPKDYILVVRSLNCSRLMVWKKLYFPSIAPYLVTGLVTGAGGAWNATIMAELFTWNGKVVHATGIGALMKMANEQGDGVLVAWTVIMMCMVVMVVNILVWQPLYEYTTKRFQ
ncbi:ABC transporter permease subunit [Gammaproteobacteria bacterium]|nr:ABC transporter permease subunit [Gammaproteobacteria bacterium]